MKKGFFDAKQAKENRPPNEKFSGKCNDGRTPSETPKEPSSKRESPQFKYCHDVRDSVAFLRKQHEFESLDQHYNFTEIRRKIDTDPDFHDYWINWVTICPFVWRFIFGMDVAKPFLPAVGPDGKWLREKYKEAVGQEAYDRKIKETKEIVRRSGETIASCL